jgi:hypothetical protein
VINTDVIEIPDETKMTVHLDIIYNGNMMRSRLIDSANVYNGNIGIETRGASTSFYDQKSFSFEFRDSIGNDTSLSILGLPEGSDFALRAPYADKSLFRDALTYQLAREMGEYAPRVRFCEVLFNGNYEGMYELVELNKRDSSRINISKLKTTDIEGEELTGGYIVKIDRPLDEGFELFPPSGVTENGAYFQYVYPKKPQPEQRDYIKNYIDSFQIAVKKLNLLDTVVGWRHFADEASFIDHFLMNELARNVDAYRLSGFYHKNKNGKLKAGPQWDHNFSWRNADYCNEYNYYGWTFSECSDVPFWWKHLLLDTTYQNNMRCRWKELRTSVLSEKHIFSVIDSMSNLVQEAQVRHYNRWDILGKYVWPNPYPIANTHQEEIANMKRWISNRLPWLDLNIKGRCGNEPILNQTASDWSINPNPVIDYFEIKYNGYIANIYLECVDMSGKVILSQKIKDQETIISTNNWATGVYYVLIKGKINEDIIIYKREKIVKML